MHTLTTVQLRPTPGLTADVIRKNVENIEQTRVAQVGDQFELSTPLEHKVATLQYQAADCRQEGRFLGSAAAATTFCALTYAKYGVGPVPVDTVVLAGMASLAFSLGSLAAGALMFANRCQKQAEQLHDQAQLTSSTFKDGNGVVAHDGYIVSGGDQQRQLGQRTSAAPNALEPQVSRPVVA